MPSIEILAVGQVDPDALLAECAELAFAVAVDPARQSHREPSRFQADFDRLPGVLYHLGNADLKNPEASGHFFAYDLLSRGAKVGDGPFRFARKYRGAVEELLEALLEQRGVARLLFSTDWQFGPPWTLREDEISLAGFWLRHNRGELRLNALYPIIRG